MDSLHVLEASLLYWKGRRARPACGRYVAQSKAVVMIVVMISDVDCGMQGWKGDSHDEKARNHAKVFASVCLPN